MRGRTGTCGPRASSATRATCSRCRTNSRRRSRMRSNVHLTPSEQSRLTAAPSVSPEAHDAYLKGRYFFNRPSDENLERPLRNSRRQSSWTRSLHRPTRDVGRLPLGRVQRGFSHGDGCESEGQGIAEKAVQLDEAPRKRIPRWLSSSCLRVRLGGVRARISAGDRPQPELLVRARSVRHGARVSGTVQEAIAESARAIELDPLSPRILVDATMPFLFQRKLAEAKALSRKAAELDPTFFFP